MHEHPGGRPILNHSLSCTNLHWRSPSDNIQSQNIFPSHSHVVQPCLSWERVGTSLTGLKRRYLDRRSPIKTGELPSSTSVETSTVNADKRRLPYIFRQSGSREFNTAPSWSGTTVVIVARLSSNPSFRPQLCNHSHSSNHPFPSLRTYYHGTSTSVDTVTEEIHTIPA